eukprot:jgi/Mesvir1/3316/Mv08152-RA.1
MQARKSVLNGGLELLVGNKKEHQVEMPEETEEQGRTVTVRRLIAWICKQMVTERPELFVKGDSVRPGILVLINDVDWELNNKLDELLQDGDRVTFISTLHGG